MIYLTGRGEGVHAEAAVYQSGIMLNETRLIDRCMYNKMNFIICHVELDGGDRYSVGWADSKARFKIEQRQRRIGTERGVMDEKKE